MRIYKCTALCKPQQHFYVVRLRPSADGYDYLCVDTNGTEANAPNFWPAGDLVDNATEDEIELTNKTAADFAFCGTWAFKKLFADAKKIAALKAEVAACDAALLRFKQVAAETFEIDGAIIENFAKMIKLVENMRKNQNARGVMRGLYENQIDAQLGNLRAIMPKFNK